MYTVDGEDLERRVNCLVDHNKIDAVLSNFPVYIDLSLFSDTFWDNVKSDGGDVRVTLSDGTTRVPVELKSFNSTAKTGLLFTKLSSISAAVDTGFKVYWGNAALSQPASSSTYGSQNVWDSNFVLVAHLQESGDGTADEFKDSTSFANHGQGGSGNSAKVPDRITDFLGYAQDFITGNKDHINFGMDTSLSCVGGITLEVLVNHDQVNIHGVYMIKSNVFGSLVEYEFRHTNTGKVHFRIRGTGNILVGTTTLSAGVDYYISATWDGTTSGINKYIYINGVQEASASQTEALTDSITLNLTSGAMDATNNFNALNGIMAELRLSDVDRSAAWQKATDANLRNVATFYSIGTYEYSPSGPGETARAQIIN